MRRSIAALLFAIPLPAAAAFTLWLDPERSSVQFTVLTLGGWPVQGVARPEGTIRFEDGLATVAVRAPLVTLRMRRQRDRDWALSPEFFWAERHPNLSFDAEVDAGRLRAKQALIGRLRVRGLARPTRFDVIVSDCHAGVRQCRVQARGELSRRDFGMRARWPIVADRVRIALDLYWVRSP